MEGWKHKGSLGWAVFAQLRSLSISCYWEKMLRTVSSLFSSQLTAKAKRKQKEVDGQMKYSEKKWKQPKSISVLHSFQFPDSSP